MFLFGIVEYCRFIMVLQLVNNAAREGARAAVVNQSTMTTTQLQGVVMSYLAGQDVQLQSLSIQAYQVDPATGNNLGSWTSAGFGQAIAVQVQGTYKPLLPSFLFMPSGVTVQGTAIMYSEAD
jgi:Flp pilus assembly protein TadG